MIISRRCCTILTVKVRLNCLQVFVAGYDVRSSLSGAFQAMGYCPQHDPIWEFITLKEHIEVYAAIRGVPMEDIPTVTE